MSTPRYVQHVSGQGEKWEVTGVEEPTAWRVYDKTGVSLFLPKSEYTLCDPPERWVDVSGECEVREVSQCIRIDHNSFDVVGALGGRQGYRLRKVQVTRYEEDTGLAERGVFRAFIVERREP